MKLKRYVGKCLELYGNTIVSYSVYEELGTDGIAEAVKKQFGYDCKVTVLTEPYISEFEEMPKARTKPTILLERINHGSKRVI